MPLWSVKWSMAGTATVEADDEADAEMVMEDAMEHFSTIDLESIDVGTTAVNKIDLI
jgi:hypothetical protein